MAVESGGTGGGNGGMGEIGCGGRAGGGGAIAPRIVRGDLDDRCGHAPVERTKTGVGITARYRFDTTQNPCIVTVGSTTRCTTP